MPGTAEERPARTAVTGRAATIGRLAAELAVLAAEGDLEGARLVHETIGRLLAPAVLPLAKAGAERRKRNRLK